MLNKRLHEHIYAIYGFVRLADEIVDTFHETNQEDLLDKFSKDTYEAIDQKISMNPILHSFQRTVNLYNINRRHIDAFLHSMAMDLNPQNYDENKFEEYIYGSAEVVGLMCLHVFCEGDNKLYNDLEVYAKDLGSAFQKVNFLRDLKDDMNDLGRSYFPNVEIKKLDEETKRKIENDIQEDFDNALIGIKKLPPSSRFGVYTAYIYYLELLRQIKNESVDTIMEKRIRVSNLKKFILLLISRIKILTNTV